MPPKESIPNPKNILWEEKLKSLENVVDRLGRHIDEEIMETLVSFDLNHIPTYSSCGGHLETGRLRFPYVSGEAEGRPKYAYVGQGDIESEIAKKYNITPSEIRAHTEAKKEYRERLNACEVSEKYREWQANDQELPLTVGTLLEEFYQSRSSTEDVRLVLRERMAVGYYMVTRNYIYPKEIPSKEVLTQDQLDEIRLKIISAREEFQAFADFLKQRFLAQ